MNWIKAIVEMRKAWGAASQPGIRCELTERMAVTYFDMLYRVKVTVVQADEVVVYKRDGNAYEMGKEQFNRRFVEVL